MTGMLPDDASDAELVQSCVADGRAEAFEMLMSRYQDRVYRTIGRFVRDPDQAMDLTQETFLRAWRGLGSFQGGSEFYTWLYRIARNVVTSDHRRAAARPRIVASIEARPEEGRSAAEPADLGGGPEAALLSRERQQRLVDALDMLVPDFREIILLRDVESRSYEEIAELLEIPVGTVRSRLHRARLELKARMGPLA
ncbi:MAG: sigma-70 family RNA polymerase sigma factor [Planctomycetota bacterium]